MRGSVDEGAGRCQCNKKPLVPVRHARGARRCVSAGPVDRPRSADALSKYENSGAHGTDPPSGRIRTVKRVGRTSHYVSTDGGLRDRLADRRHRPAAATTANARAVGSPRSCRAAVRRAAGARPSGPEKARPWPCVQPISRSASTCSGVVHPVGHGLAGRGRGRSAAAREVILCSRADSTSALDQRAVQRQHVDRESPQRDDGGVPAAEPVQRDPHPEPAQRDQPAFQLVQGDPRVVVGQLDDAGAPGGSSCRVEQRLDGSRRAGRGPAAGGRTAGTVTGTRWPSAVPARRPVRPPPPAASG